MSIATKLAKLKTIKQDIKSALEEKGQTPSNVFSTYANNIRAIEMGGGSGEITIPSVTNLVVSEKGVATWSAPDITSLASYNPVISYLVSVNGNEAIETSDTTISLKLVLQDGSNTISVVVKALLTNNKDTSTTIEYSKPIESIITLDSKLSKASLNYGVASVGTNIYIFLQQQAVQKFDTISDTITTLSATPLDQYAPLVVSPQVIGKKIYIIANDDTYYDYYTFVFDTDTYEVSSTNKSTDKFVGKSFATIGSNIYSFGGRRGSSNYFNLIKKFDTENLTYSTLSTTLPFNLVNSYACAIGSYIYIFGGIISSSERSNAILKFDSTTETVTTLDVIMPISANSFCGAVIGTNIYLFGGFDGSNKLNTIVKFDSVNLICETRELILPNASTFNESSADSANGVVYIFGGNTSNGDTNDILKYTAE